MKNKTETLSPERREERRKVENGIRIMIRIAMRILTKQEENEAHGAG